MKTQTWNGSDNLFETAAAWSLGTVPVDGDTAIINAGTVTETGTLSGVAVILGAGSGATLNLAGATLGATTSVSVASYQDTLLAAGVVTNFGVVSLAGPVSQSPNLDIEADASNAAVFRNYGTLDIEASPTIFTINATGSAVLENDGQIVVNNAIASGQQMPIIAVPVTGTGTITLNNAARVDFLSSVAAGQTVVFSPTTKNSILQLDQPSSSPVTIQGFVSSDLIALINLPETSLSYVSTSATSGTLQLSSGGSVVASETLKGVYTAADFTKTYTSFGGSGSNTNILTSATTPTVSYTDVATGASGQALDTLYSGPVGYLQWQYLWPSADAVAMSSSTPNVFIKGGPGGDAIQVTSGNNVVDAGGGSNFIVGGTGNDTFFVDGRGGDVTWNTIKNFHQGDQATIFGFVAGVSTMPVSASDGAAGYEGVTIHSQLGGTGTPVDASITFTGLSTDTYVNHFSVTSGTLGSGDSATPYLLIQYDH